MIPDEVILEAMRYPARIRLKHNLQSVLEHIPHAEFNYEESAWKRSFTFSCSCSTGFSKEINLSSLRSNIPETRRRLENVRFQARAKISSIQKRNKIRAEKKARALLFKYLTRDRVRIFKKLGYFTVNGQDGLEYSIQRGQHNIISKEGLRYCLIPDIDMEIPSYDVLLAQKLMIENNTNKFLELAHVVPNGIEERDMETPPEEIPHRVGNSSLKI